MFPFTTPTLAAPPRAALIDKPAHHIDRSNVAHPSNRTPERDGKWIAGLCQWRRYHRLRTPPGHDGDSWNQTHPRRMLL